MSSNTNKRIAKNTLLLYLRLIIVMGVSLFTVRIVLKTLGIEDYGIYNVVACIVTMFDFVTTTLSTGTVRFFSFQLGNKNQENLNKLFNLSLLFFLIVIVITFLLSETLGVWFLNTQMTLPESRLSAANWVFQISIISFAIHLLVVPYKSLIISYEKMSIYAYVSIVEVILKLLIVYVLVISPLDKLKVYSVLLLFTSIVTAAIYIIYCKKKIPGCRLYYFWNKDMFTELFEFCGWNLLGAMSSVLRNQGINILLNIFFNPVVNAARAIAFQINNAVNNFVLNFYTAFRPQITKQYAANDINGMLKLVLASSKLSFYLIYFLSLPILIEIPYVLKLWLSNVPEYTDIFARLVMLNAIIESLTYPLSAAVLATGKNKWYQIVTGGILLLNLPIAYVLLELGYYPQITMIISIVLTILSIAARLYFMKRYFLLSITKYFSSVLCYIFYVSSLSCIFPLFLHHIMGHGLVRFLTVTIVSMLCTLSFTYAVGLSRNEKKMILSFLGNKLSFINKFSKNNS